MALLGDDTELDDRAALGAPSPEMLRLVWQNLPDELKKQYMQTAPAGANELVIGRQGDYTFSAPQGQAEAPQAPQATPQPALPPAGSWLGGLMEGAGGRAQEAGEGLAQVAKESLNPTLRNSVNITPAQFQLLQQGQPIEPKKGPGLAETLLNLTPWGPASSAWKASDEADQGGHAGGKATGQALFDLASMFLPAAKVAKETRAVSRAAVDGTLGKTRLPPVMFRGKEPKDMNTSDYYHFGEHYGVKNLGDKDEAAWRAGLGTVRTLSGRDITIPGGVDGTKPFTLYDLAHLKAQGFDPNDLPAGVHQKIHDRTVAAMQPPPGSTVSDIQMGNQLMFAMLSPAQNLTNNEFAAGRMMLKGQKDLDWLSKAVPYRLGAPEGSARAWPPANKAGSDQRRAIGETNVKDKTGVGARPEGLGVSGNMDYSNFPALAQKLKKDPDFFRFNPDDPTLAGMSLPEKWAAHVTRVGNEVRGLGVKTGSFGLVWQDPQHAMISAVDRHIANIFRTQFFPDPVARRAWETRVLSKFNEAHPNDTASSINEMIGKRGGRGFFHDQALNYLGQHPGKVLRHARTGEFNPDVPKYLRDTKWVGPEPEKVDTISPAYTRTLEAQAPLAAAHGHGIFSHQWFIWDPQRQRYEPHMIMFPGLEKLPRMNMKQAGDALQVHKDAGYTVSNEKVKPVANPSSMIFFNRGAPLIGAGAGAATIAPGLLNKDDKNSR